MEINELLTILTSILVLFNTAQVITAAWRKLKPEVKKLQSEAESELQEATNLNLEGAKISAQMLLDRINELKGELDTEKRLRKEGMAMAEKSHSESIEAMKKSHTDSIIALEKSRKEDREYFRRRIKEIDRELRAYRSYSAKLSKQVIEAGRIPVALVFDYTDSDPSVQAIRPELEDGPESSAKDGKE